MLIKLRECGTRDDIATNSLPIRNPSRSVSRSMAFRLSKVDNMRATVLLGKPTSVAISVKLMPSLCLEMVFRISKARRTERMSSDIIFLIL